MGLLLNIINNLKQILFNIFLTNNQILKEI